MAQVSRASQASAVATKLADNGAGDISAQDLREVVTDLEDSAVWYDEVGALAPLDTVDTAQIDDEAVTLPKLAHLATARILGRNTSGTGDVEALTAAQTIALLAITASDIPIVDAGGLTDETELEGVIAEILNTLDNNGSIVTADLGDYVEVGQENVTNFDAGGTHTTARPAVGSTDTVIWFNHGSQVPTNLGTRDIAFGGASTETIVVECSEAATDLATGTGVQTFRMPFAMTVTEVRASVTTAPTGSTITVDINEGGSSILSTKLTIDATEKTSTTAATAAVLSDAALADDAEITIDIDQVGSTVAGQELKVSIIGTRA